MAQDDQQVVHFRLFVVFLTYLAYDMLVPILSIYFKEIGLTITLIGILISIVGLIRMFISLISGIVAKLFGRFKILIVGYVFTAISIIVHAIPNTLIITFARILLGIFGTFLTPILWSYITELSSYLKSSGKFMSLVNLMTVITMIIAPSISGFLAKLYSLSLPIIISGILLATVTLMIIPFRKIDTSYRTSINITQIRGYFVKLIRIKPLLYTFILGFLKFT